MAHPVLTSIIAAGAAYDAHELSDEDVRAKLGTVAFGGTHVGGYFVKGCVERKVKDVQVSLGLIDPALVGEYPASVLMRMEAGNAFEAKVGAALAAAARGTRQRLVTLTGDRTEASKAAREAATRKAMADGAALIWNARLVVEGFSLEPDLLVRGPRRSDGTWGYHPADVKDHRPTTGDTIGKAYPVSALGAASLAKASPVELPGRPVEVDNLQLAAYQRALELVGHAVESDEVWGAIIGRPALGEELTLVWRRLDVPLNARTKHTAMSKFDTELERRRSIVARRLVRLALPTVPAHPDDRGPQLSSECKECPMWDSLCKPDLLEADDITLVPGITPARADVHHGAGITRRSQLARLHTPTAIAVDAKVDVPASLAAASYLPAEIARRTPAADVITLTRGGRLDDALDALAGAGIRTAADVAGLDALTGSYSGLGAWHLVESIDRARVAKSGKVHRARGVERLELPRAAIELDFDVEDVPIGTLVGAGVDPYAGLGDAARTQAMETGGTLVYMIGIKATGRRRRGGNEKVRSEMNMFADYTGTVAGERKVFRTAWEYLTMMRTKARLDRHSLRAYHYTDHERHVFKMLASRHAGSKGIPTVAEVEEFFDSDAVIDLHKVVDGSLLWPTLDTTLKTVAGWSRYTWADEDPSGGNSIAWYLQAIGSTTKAAKAEWAERIEVYNTDDVSAQLAIREFLSRLASSHDSRHLPAVERLERTYQGRPSL